MRDATIWTDGKEYILYSTDIRLVRDFLRRKNVRLYGEYFDRQGKVFALQVKFIKDKYCRAAKFFGLAEAEPSE